MKSSTLKKLTKTTLATVIFFTAALAIGNSALADEDCFITQDSWDHIYPLHCRSADWQDRSKLLPGNCANMDTAELFCEMVQNARVLNRIVQDNDRIRYEADFNFAVGTEGEECAVMIIVNEDDGEVITQYPEFC